MDKKELSLTQCLSNAKYDCERRDMCGDCKFKIACSDYAVTPESVFQYLLAISKIIN